MTSQEIFNKVWKHFVVEGNPRSVDADGVCRYRGRDGSRCAAGIFIPDAQYSEDLEGISVTCLFLRVPAFAALAGHQGLLRELQRTHDAPYSWATRDGLRVSLEFVANIYDLKVPQ